MVIRQSCWFSPIRIVIIKKLELADPIEVGSVIFRMLYVFGGRGSSVGRARDAM